MSENQNDDIALYKKVSVALKDIKDKISYNIAFAHTSSLFDGLMYAYDLFESSPIFSKLSDLYYYQTFQKMDKLLVNINALVKTQDGKEDFSGVVDSQPIGELLAFMYQLAREYEILYGKLFGAMDFVHAYVNDVMTANGPGSPYSRYIVPVANEQVLVLAHHSGLHNLHEIKFTINQWENNYIVRHTRQAELEQKLDYETERLSFVTLVKAFNDLLKTKNIDLANAITTMQVMGTILVVIPIAVLYALFCGLVLNKMNLFYYFIPGAATLIIFLTYFFRLAYSNYKATKVQIMQLQMRRALCQFIQEYVKFSDNHSSSQHSLLGFENAIFGALVDDPKEIPTAFDGLDQIARLLEAIRKK